MRTHRVCAYAVIFPASFLAFIDDNSTTLHKILFPVHIRACTLENLLFCCGVTSPLSHSCITVSDDTHHFSLV